MSRSLTILLATACGLIAANIYYSQPLVGIISKDLDIDSAVSGFIITSTQLGYGFGLLLIVPLLDLIENRKLVIGAISVAFLGLVGAYLAENSVLFLAFAFFIGLGSSAMQVIVPYASHLASEGERGQVVATVMTGLLLGMMLARPVASFITEISSWRMVYLTSALAMIILLIVLKNVLPVRYPTSPSTYLKLLLSMWHFALSLPILRRRSFYHSCLFASFSIFWTASPLLLMGSNFGLSQGGLSLFGLAGAAGVIAAPIAGRIADRGWIRSTTWSTMSAVVVVFIVVIFSQNGNKLSLFVLFAAGVVIDFAVAAHMIISQRVVFSLNPEHRGRLNGVYISTIFLGGALGSAVAAWSYTIGGWYLVCGFGMLFPLLALLAFWTERR